MTSQDAIMASHGVVDIPCVNVVSFVLYFLECQMVLSHIYPAIMISTRWHLLLGTDKVDALYESMYLWSMGVDPSWQRDFGAKELYNTGRGRCVNAQAFSYDICFVASIKRKYTHLKS